MLEDLIERLEADGPTPALARACAERAFPSWGDSIPEAVRYAERALALAEELDLPDVRATALGFRGASLVVMGDKRGLADERKAIATAIDGSLTSNVYTNYANLVMGMSYEAPMGALDIADEGLAFVRSRGMSDGETMIRVVRLEALYQSGRWDELLSESEALRESTRQQGDRWGLIGASFPMAWVLSVTGRAEAALELYESLKLEKHESEVAMDFAGPRARALRERGDVAQAAYVLEQVISRREAEQLPLRESLPHVIREAVALGRRDLLARCGLLCIGDVALSRHGLTTVQALIAEMDGEFVEAERAFSFAEAGWEEMGNPFERALALLGRGRCLYALRRSSARSYLSAATAALKSLGASLPVLAGNTTSQRRLD
jgi:hypothetical protein